MSKLIDETGNVYNKLTVIRRVRVEDENYAYWLCQCKCGNTAVIRGTHLRSGNNQSCGCYQQDNRSKYSLPKGRASANTLYSIYKWNANKRSISWGLSKEEFFRLAQMLCFYCGAKPKQRYKNSGGNGAYIHNGIDRVDSNKGYTSENCVSCCKHCNRAKWDRDVEEFLEWIETVHNHQQQKERRMEKC